MNKSLQYSRLESIEITLTPDDVAGFLRDAKHVPDGFKIDRAQGETEWPINIRFVQVTANDGEVNGG